LLKMIILCPLTDWLTGGPSNHSILLAVYARTQDNNNPGFTNHSSVQLHMVPTTGIPAVWQDQSVLNMFSSYSHCSTHLHACSNRTAEMKAVVTRSCTLLLFQIPGFTFAASFSGHKQQATAKGAHCGCTDTWPWGICIHGLWSVSWGLKPDSYSADEVPWGCCQGKGSHATSPLPTNGQLQWTEQEQVHTRTTQLPGEKQGVQEGNMVKRHHFQFFTTIC